MQALFLGMDYTSEQFRRGAAQGMRFMMDIGGPVYIHCLEGKDRTGFVCMVLEALAGADYEEMCGEYMKSYENYYGITKEKTPDKYDAVVARYFDTFAAYLCGIRTPDTGKCDALRKADYAMPARRYLLGCGLTKTEIDGLEAFLTAGAG